MERRGDEISGVCHSLDELLLYSALEADNCRPFMLLLRPQNREKNNKVRLTMLAQFHFCFPTSKAQRAKFR